MDSRHADSVLCTTDNPNSVDDLESVINQDPGTRYLQTRSPRSKESSENTTRIIEKSDNTRVEQPTTREPPADDNDDGEALIDMPEIPEIDVPEVEVPEMDLPVVGNTGDWTDVVTADSDE